MEEHSEHSTAYLGFRRRCSWCGVVLRGWQLNMCRLCKTAASVEWLGAPCVHGSRWDEAPDEWIWTRGWFRTRYAVWKTIMKRHDRTRDYGA